MEEKAAYQDSEVGMGVLGFPQVQHGVQGREKQQLECFSDEVDSRGGAVEESKDASGGAAPAAGGGMSIETGKRRRGRPPGSKNKPKPPLVVTRNAAELPAAAMRPYVLEIPGGSDVAAALAGFARRRGLGICVLAGTGAVADVPLRHTSPDAGGGGGAAIVFFRGRYDILSISATFLPPSTSAVEMSRALGDLSVSLAAPHGRIVGGAVAGPLVAATTVVVVAAALTNPTFHRLPEDDAASASTASGSGDSGNLHRGHHQPEPQQQQQLHQVSRLPSSHSTAPATRPAPLYTRAACQPHEVWTPAASTTPSPRPPYE